MNIHFDNFYITDFDSRQSILFFNLMDKNRIRLEDFFAGTVSKTKTLEDTITYCSVIKQRIKNKFIGLIDIKNIDWNVPKAEIGDFIDSNYEGKGIISKSLAYVIKYLKQTYQFKKLLCRFKLLRKSFLTVIKWFSFTIGS